MTAVTYEFYHSFWAPLICSPWLIWYLSEGKKKYSMKRQELLRRQFRDMTLSLSGSLSAGFSVENGMEEAEKEMKQLWGSSSLICKELSRMKNRMGLGKSLESAWLDFGRESGLEDVEDFAQIFAVLKKTGGDFSGNLKRTAEQIGEKIRTEQEIQTLIASRKLELRIMNWVPVGILLYLNFSAPELLGVMYEGAMGRCVMTACLAVYLGACAMGRRITEISV